MSARVLVVDDALTDRELVKTFLDKAGHTVVGEAGTGEEAVEAYRRLVPDVVLMDLVMPRMNGCDAARAILAFDPAARIVAMSGLSQPSVQADADEAGMLGFVPKPIEVDELLAEVDDALKAG